MSVVLDVQNDVCSALPVDGLESHVDSETAQLVDAARKRALAEKRLLERQVRELTSQAGAGKDDKRIFDAGERERAAFAAIDMSKWNRGSVLKRFYCTIHTRSAD